MPRSLAALPVLACALAAAGAAPAPKPVPPPVYYFPTRVGAKWVLTDLTANRDRTFSVAAVEEKDGAKVVTVCEEVNGRQLPSEVVAVSAAGLFRRQGGPFKLDPPLCHLKFPHKPGDKWDWHVGGKPGLAECKGTVTVHPAESVAVPAGTYTAIRVVFEGTEDGRPDRVAFWYAPDVGLVKRANTKFHQVLKSFTPAP
jgi:hypothetical protein